MQADITNTETNIIQLQMFYKQRMFAAISEGEPMNVHCKIFTQTISELYVTFLSKNFF